MKGLRVIYIDLVCLFTRLFKIVYGYFTIIVIVIDIVITISDIYYNDDYTC